jgi:hypothetical protein
MFAAVIDDGHRSTVLAAASCNLILARPRDWRKLAAEVSPESRTLSGPPSRLWRLPRPEVGIVRVRFADQTNLASMLGTTFDFFDWPGVLETNNRFDAIELPPGTQWDLNQLYVTGTAKLTAIPEPSAVLLLACGTAACAVARLRSLATRRRLWQTAYPVCQAAVGASGAALSTYHSPVRSWDRVRLTNNRPFLSRLQFLLMLAIARRPISLRLESQLACAASVLTTDARIAVCKTAAAAPSW